MPSGSVLSFCMTNKSLKKNLANKLTRSHLEFKKQKMKVRLAAQVLSASCANALQYLRQNKYPGYLESLATEKFLHMIGKLFDILNTHSPFGKGYKSAMNTSNIASRVEFLQEANS